MMSDTEREPKRMRVLIADDHRMFRQGLRQILETQPDMEVIGEAADGVEVVEKAVRLQPDVVLVDINMPGKDGVAAIREITERLPKARCIVITMYRRDRYLFEAIKAGAYGYLLKDADAADLLRAIRAVQRGEALVDPAIAARLLEEFRHPEQAETPQEGLTQRDVELLRLLAQALGNAEIAEKLFVSEKTVRNRLSVIFQKLHLSNRTEAALYALREGLASLPDEDPEI